jgi:hypothetical protein
VKDRLICRSGFVEGAVGVALGQAIEGPFQKAARLQVRADAGLAAYFRVILSSVGSEATLPWSLCLVLQNPQSLKLIAAHSTV